MKNTLLIRYTSETLNRLSNKGIYKISNNIDNRVYIGSTCCNGGFYERWLSHIRDLKNNNHHCIHLQNFVNKYGIESIYFEIVEILNENIVIIRNREKFWIDYYDFNNCFNTSSEVDLSEVCGKKNYKYKEISFQETLSLFMKGIKISEIAKTMKCSESKIKTVLYKNGISSLEKSTTLPLTEIYFRNMLGSESIVNLAKEYNVDKWTIRTSLRKAGFPSRSFLINEYFTKFKNVKENIKSWAEKLPFDYCTFHKMSKHE